MAAEKTAIHRTYVCPPADAGDDRILGWFKESESEGLAFLPDELLPFLARPDAVRGLF